MLKAAFLLLRVLTAIASLAALAGTLIVIFVKGAFAFAKEGAQVAIALAKIFASAFQRSSPAPPHEHILTIPLVGLLILFSSMFVSVFTPNQKIFLHIVAAMAVATTAWRISIMIHTADNQLLFLPAIAVWFIYYAICFYRR
jgi:hypothetical protein